MDVCPVKAISYSAVTGEKKPVFDRSKCVQCVDKRCIEKCPNEAIRLAGEMITVEEAFNRTKEDIRFFWNSNGGITFSGGEPLIYSLWVLTLLKIYEPLSVNGVIETCGYWEPDDTIREIAGKSIRIYYDIKSMDDEVHRSRTGVSNVRILDNLRWLATIIPEKIVVSLPVIPGISESIKNAEETSVFLKKQGLTRIRILPYHRLGVSKYEELGRVYPHTPYEESISEECFEKIKKIYKDRGFLFED
jgi:pyruvate formate lyase activating enzyme